MIKAVVGEDWILERTQSGKLAFVIYMNTFHHTLRIRPRSICANTLNRLALGVSAWHKSALRLR